MRMLIVILTYLVCCKAASIERCFQGGELIRQIASEVALPHMCLKDDISVIKVETEALQKGNEHTQFTTRIYRKFMIDDWKNCRPERMIGGPLMILSVDDKGHLESEEYICRNDCIIKIDKELGLVIFETTSLNYFEVSGTTITSGWFKTSTSVSLKHTCEHVKIQCGMKAYSMHACFKNHIECYQMLSHRLIPKYMSVAICTNIETIILLVFTLMIFCIFMIAAKTYISYLLIPLFIPISYIYGKFYGKSCKMCQNCGLASHPFTKCSTICVCGTVYTSTERLKIHRLSGLCQGYKYIMTARVMCKSKGCGLVLSILLSLLVLSFVTPIGAEPCYSIDDLPKIYKESIKSAYVNEIYRYVALFLTPLVIGFILAAVILLKCPHKILNRFVYNCHDCKMYHKKHGIKIDEFGTNKCGTCLCGCTDENPMYVVHQRSRICFSDIHISTYKFMLLISLMVFLPLLVPAAMASKCDTNIESTDCWGLNLQKKVKAEGASGSIKSKLDNLFSDVEDFEIGRLEKYKSNYEKIITDSYEDHYLRPVQMRESIWAITNTFMSFDFKESDMYIKWKIKTKVLEINLCKHSVQLYPCQCMKNEMHCDVLTKNLKSKTNADILLTDNAKLVEDSESLLKALSGLIHPTTMAKVKYMITKKNDAEFVKLTNEILEMYKEFPYLDNIIYLALNVTSKAGLSKATAPSLGTIGLTRPINTRASQFVSPRTQKAGKSSCKKVFCTSPRLGTSPTHYLLCETKKIYHWDQTYANNTGNICYGDANCDLFFPSFTTEELTEFNRINRNCIDAGEYQLETKYSHSRGSCRMREKGFCELGGVMRQIVKCASNLYYEQVATGAYGTSGHLDQICFKPKCERVYPRNPQLLKNCTISVPKQQVIRSRSQQIDDLENYRAHFEESFYSTLSTFEYKKTAGLPSIVPTYKSITVTGTQTTTGIEGMSFNLDMSAIAGEAIGLNVNTPDGVHVMDLIVFIKSANVSSAYNLLYRTGPTISYNSVHSEKCTGACPEHVKLRDETWMEFTKESTSTWGCEEFGCLAINVGCFYGQCKDIIKPEMDIYRKETEEKSSIELCVTSSHDTYCVILDSTQALITGKINAQFKTVEAFNLPQMVAIKQHRVYHGQINNIGEFSNYCGNVQYYNHTTIGKGTPKVDYRCHAASRKDIIIRKCFENAYDSCRALFEDEKMTIDHVDEQTTEIAYHEKNLGILSLQLTLGDMQYKLYQENPQVEIGGKCVGCHNCINGIQCDIEIRTAISAICDVKSDCKSMLSRIKLDPSKYHYSDKFLCQSDIKFIHIKICSTEAKIPVTLSKRRPMLEIGTIGHAPVLLQHDNKCGTWICRVGEEISTLLDFNVSGFFNKLWHYAVLIVVLFFSLMVFKYIVYPTIALIIETLKKHDEEQKRLQKIK
ncbi:polyprotein [Lukuni virus]|uniref:Envelopment polyprotein n=1 Tax=Lukuni virus TaxID=1678227 RepID=A0A0R7FN11_9VIRU|nr:polyprotein [Lukuni virus]AKO90177.1 polyprotein [Lukuni virus]